MLTSPNMSLDVQDSDVSLKFDNVESRNLVKGPLASRFYR
jgi:hypothetical protein